MDGIEKTVKKNYVYQGKILNLRKDDALLPDGRPCVREIVEHSGGACVLYVKDGKVLLVKQFRYAYGESIYELPAGKLEKGEDPKITALRELEEETGVKAKAAEHLFTVYPTPGYTNEKIYIYEVTDGERGQTRLDDGEFLDAVFLPLDEVKAMLQSGEIKDAKTLIALQAYFLKHE